MSKLSRPVVTPSAPKAWHPKTSTKKVFWGAGSPAMPRMPRSGSVPNSVKAPMGIRVDKKPECRESVMQNGDLLRCCDSWDASGKKKTDCWVAPGYMDRGEFGKLFESEFMKNRLPRLA
jgi:hypothetical protein